MEITEIRIKLTDRNKNDIRAFASITFDDCFVVRGLKIIEKNKFFVTMPSRRRKDGSFSDIAFPINNDVRSEIELKVLEKYEQEVKK